MSEIYRIDQPHVMHEMIDDEVVVINLDTGIYYSFDDVAGRIWQLLAGEGRSADDLVAQLAMAYAGDRDFIKASVARFLDQLRAEQLAVVVEGEPSAPVASTTTAAGAPPFVEPVLQRYTDMEALLLADPIHDVDEEAGWPKVK